MVMATISFSSFFPAAVDALLFPDPEWFPSALGESEGIFVSLGDALCLLLWFFSRGSPTPFLEFLAPFLSPLSCSTVRFGGVSASGLDSGSGCGIRVAELAGFELVLGEWGGVGEEVLMSLGD